MPSAAWLLGVGRAPPWKGQLPWPAVSHACRPDATLIRSRDVTLHSAVPLILETAEGSHSLLCPPGAWPKEKRIYKKKKAVSGPL